MFDIIKYEYTEQSDHNILIQLEAMSKNEIWAHYIGIVVYDITHNEYKKISEWLHEIPRYTYISSLFGFKITNKKYQYDSQKNLYLFT